MEIRKLRSSLQNGGTVCLYATFISGYFLLPMAAGHRRLSYTLVVPAALPLGRGCLVDPQVTAHEKLINHANNSFPATVRDGQAVGLVLLLGLTGLALVWAGRLWARGGERICLALLLSFAGALATAAVPAPPAWEVLEFEQRGFGVTARSRLQLSEDGTGGHTLALKAQNSIANNTEVLSLRLDPASYRLLERSRLSQGRDQRYKAWTYKAGHVLRERREPGRDATRPPEEWPLSSRREVPYPEAVGDLPVTDAYALLPLAGQFLEGGSQSAEVIVHTDLNFYRVRMTRGDGAYSIIPAFDWLLG